MIFPENVRGPPGSRRQSQVVTRRTSTYTTDIQVQNQQIILVMSLKYTPVTQSKLCLIFLMYVRTNNVSTTVDTNLKKKNTLFAANDSDTSLTLQQGEGYQTWHKLVDRKQG